MPSMRFVPITYSVSETAEALAQGNRDETASPYRQQVSYKHSPYSTSSALPSNAYSNGNDKDNGSGYLSDTILNQVLGSSSEPYSYGASSTKDTNTTCAKPHNFRYADGSSIYHNQDQADIHSNVRSNIPESYTSCNNPTVKVNSSGTRNVLDHYQLQQDGINENKHNDHKHEDTSFLTCVDEVLEATYKDGFSIYSSDYRSTSSEESESEFRDHPHQQSKDDAHNHTQMIFDVDHHNEGKGMCMSTRLASRSLSLSTSKITGEIIVHESDMYNAAFIENSKGMEEQFNENLEKLRKFKAKYGIKRLPCCAGEYKKLGEWCKLLRQSKRNMDDRMMGVGKRTYVSVLPGFHLTTRHMEQLKELNFNWKSTYTFEERLEELKAFKSEFGHCNVKTTDTHMTSLRNWSQCMRTRRRELEQMTGNPYDAKITHDQIKRLSALGFRWSRINCCFEDRLEELRQFKGKYGNCDVSPKRGHHKPLGEFCKRVRRQRKHLELKKRGCEYLPSTQLTESNIQSLTELGFR